MGFEAGWKFQPCTEPQWSPQNRPTVVRAKPANGRGRGLSCFTPRLPAEASLFSCANFADRILEHDRDGGGDRAWRGPPPLPPPTSPPPPPGPFHAAKY